MCPRGRSITSAGPLLLLLLLLVIGGPQPVESCSCISSTISDLLSDHNLVVRATVLTDLGVNHTDYRYYRYYTLLPVTVYKGVDILPAGGESVTVMTPRWGSMCGVRLDEDEDYLLFMTSRAGAGAIYLGLCSFPRRWTPRQEEDLREAMLQLSDQKPAPDPGLHHEKDNKQRILRRRLRHAMMRGGH